MKRRLDDGSFLLVEKKKKKKKMIRLAGVLLPYLLYAIRPYRYMIICRVLSAHLMLLPRYTSTLLILYCTLPREKKKATEPKNSPLSSLTLDSISCVAAFAKRTSEFDY